MPTALGTVASHRTLVDTGGTLPVTSGLLGWFDAADAASFDVSTGYVSIWRDRSANLVHAVTPATHQNDAYRPSRVANVLKGRSALYFEGTSQRMLDTPMSAATKPFTCIALLIAESASTEGCYLGVAAPGTMGPAFRVSSANSIPNVLVPGWDNLATATSRVLLGAPSLISWTYSAAHDWASFLNGAVNGSGNKDIAFTAGRTSQIGTNNNYGADQFKGYICELVKYDRVLTTVERQQVESYLTAKWISPVGAPVPINGLQGWYDADAASTFSLSGTVVTQWRDKSGWGHHFSGGSVNRNGTQNGRTSVVTTDEYAAMSTSVPVAASVDDFSIFIVCKRTGGSTTSLSFLNGNGAGNGYGPATRVYSENIGFLRGGIAWEPSTTADDGALNLYTLQRNGGIWGHYINGTATSLNGAAIGAPVLPTTSSSIPSAAGGHGFAGDVCEVLVYNTVLTTVERQDIESYLRTKWGTPMPEFTVTPDHFDMPWASTTITTTNGGPYTNGVTQIYRANYGPASGYSNPFISETFISPTSMSFQYGPGTGPGKSFWRWSNDGGATGINDFALPASEYPRNPAEHGSSYIVSEVTAEDATNAAKLAGLGFVADPQTPWTFDACIDMKPTLDDWADGNAVASFSFHWTGSAWMEGKGPWE